MNLFRDKNSKKSNESTTSRNLNDEMKNEVNENSANQKKNSPENSRNKSLQLQLAISSNIMISPKGEKLNNVSILPSSKTESKKSLCTEAEVENISKEIERKMTDFFRKSSTNDKSMLSMKGTEPNLLEKLSTNVSSTLSERGTEANLFEKPSKNLENTLDKSGTMTNLIKQPSINVESPLSKRGTERSLIEKSSTNVESMWSISRSEPNLLEKPSTNVSNTLSERGIEANLTEKPNKNLESTLDKSGTKSNLIRQPSINVESPLSKNGTKRNLIEKSSSNVESTLSMSESEPNLLENPISNAKSALKKSESEANLLERLSMNVESQLSSNGTEANLLLNEKIISKNDKLFPKSPDNKATILKDECSLYINKIIEKGLLFSLNQNSVTIKEENTTPAERSKSKLTTKEQLLSKASSPSEIKTKKSKSRYKEVLRNLFRKPSRKSVVQPKSTFELKRAGTSKTDYSLENGMTGAKMAETEEDKSRDEIKNNSPRLKSSLDQSSAVKKVEFNTDVQVISYDGDKDILTMGNLKAQESEFQSSEEFGDKATMAGESKNSSRDTWANIGFEVTARSTKIAALDPNSDSSEIQSSEMTSSEELPRVKFTLLEDSGSDTSLAQKAPQGQSSSSIPNDQISRDTKNTSLEKNLTNNWRRRLKKSPKKPASK